MPRHDERVDLLSRRAPWGQITSAARAARRGVTSAAVRLGIAALVLALAVVPGGVAASQDALAPALVVLLASDRPVYGPGMPAAFTLAVDNPGAATVTATFPSAQAYDIVVLAGETEVWRWSAGYAFAAAMTERSFPPGLTLLGREAWDWRDTDGAPLPPGIYRVVGSLESAPPLDGNPVEIVLNVP